MRRGHITCSTCVAEMGQECQWCRAPEATTTRCRAMEHFLAALAVPCSFNHKGCAAMVPYGEREAHEAACAHSPCYPRLLLLPLLRRVPGRTPRAQAPGDRPHPRRPRHPLPAQHVPRLAGPAGVPRRRRQGQGGVPPRRRPERGAARLVAVDGQAQGRRRRRRRQGGAEVQDHGGRQWRRAVAGRRDGERGAADGAV